MLCLILSYPAWCPILSCPVLSGSDEIPSGHCFNTDFIRIWSQPAAEGIWTDGLPVRAADLRILLLQQLDTIGQMRAANSEIVSRYAMLCCAVLCCAVLCCAVLCCAVLRCAVLCCAVLCCAVLCCAVLCCAVLCCAVLCCAVPCRAMLCCACCAVLCCAVLCCAVLCS
jgi:hypothetical protein